MNQILDSKDNFNVKSSSLSVRQEKRNRFFKVQFFVSSILAVFSLCFYLYFYFSSNQEEILSKKLVDNFNISQLYSNSISYETNTQLIGQFNTYEINENHFSVIGLIDIPSISITYPIISETTDDFLKIAPCKFYGANPNEIGNLCIAGHNYENYRFFSRIRELENDSSIYIYDNNGKKIEYLVYQKYETSYKDLNCTNQETNGTREITLVTCNNVTGNRIILKAKEKNLRT